MEMTKKSVLLIFIIFTLFISILAYVVMAEETNDQKVEKAYSWLISKVKSKWQTLNVKQHVFSLLALNCNSTYFNPGNKSLYDKSFNSPTIRCWGAGPSRPTGEQGCLLTETALSKIALDTWQDNTTKVRNWLLSRNMTQVSGINWYLQIDVDRGSTANCEIIYGGLEEKWFNVADDKRVSINQSSSKCFFVDPSEPYWFKIRASSDCYSYRYTIKCWSNATIYRANLLYKKTGSNIWYVSSETQTGRPGVPGSGKLEDQPNPLELQVPSYCLANPGQNTCDYEGTAWAARALTRQGDKRDANMLVPYLVVFSDDNVKYFPAAFLYSITGQERYNTEILASEKIVGLDKGYWLVQPIVYGRVYDTAHAGLSLGGSAGDAVTKAKNYLLFNQERDGNLVAVGYGEAQKEPIRDTAFALWALWGASCPGQGRGGGENLTCTDLGSEYRCSDNVTCDPDEIPIYNASCGNASNMCCKFIGTGGETDCTNVGGSCKDFCDVTEFKLPSISCPDFKDCCKSLATGTCNESGGGICDSNERCTGDIINLSDGECCIGNCIPKDTENLNCIDLAGTICETTQVCVNSLTWNIEQFTTVKDTTRCCAGTNFECVQDLSCSSISGKRCDIGETCSVSTEKTRDEEECCTGECSSAGTCESQGGNTCKSGQTCSMSYIGASDTTKCCPSSGKCKGGTSLWWLWIILIIIILGGAAYWYFFMFRKKKKPKEEGIEEESIFGLPITRPPVRPIPTTQKPMFRPQQPQGTQGARPLQKPFMQQQQKPALKPLVSKPMLRKVPNVPTPKPKGKTEDELEKTLNKLKKITKK